MLATLVDFTIGVARACTSDVGSARRKTGTGMTDDIARALATQRDYTRRLTAELREVKAKLRSAEKELRALRKLRGAMMQCFVSDMASVVRTLIGAGLTQTEVALRLGITQGYVSKLNARIPGNTEGSQES